MEKDSSYSMWMWMREVLPSSTYYYYYPPQYAAATTTTTTTTTTTITTTTTTTTTITTILHILLLLLLSIYYYYYYYYYYNNYTTTPNTTLTHTHAHTFSRIGSQRHPHFSWISDKSSYRNLRIATIHSDLLPYKHAYELFHTYYFTQKNFIPDEHLRTNNYL